MTRRGKGWVVGIVLLLTLTACKQEVKTDTLLQTKPFAGQKLTVFAANHPWSNIMRKWIPEFTHNTGMKVDLQIFSEEQLHQKMAVQLTSLAETPEVFMYRAYMDKILFYKNGWTVPLNGYVMRNEAYDFSDFSKATIESSTVNGQLMSIPLFTDQFILYYNKDVLQKNNVPVPQTLSELQEAAKKLHDPKHDFYGFVSRGQRNALVTTVSSFLFSEGGDYLDGDRATLNTPDAIRGFKIYADLLRNYGPRGVVNMSWPQSIGLFAQGKAAFLVDSAALYRNAIDPEISVVQDHVGFATFPAGSAGARPSSIASWSFAMNPKAKNRDAAWAFMEWVTNKENVLRIQRNGIPGARNSIWASKDGIEMFPSDLVKAIQDTMEKGIGHSVPSVMSVPEARDVVGGIVVKAILGEDIQHAANQANKELQTIIEGDKKN
ncbi:ABC transporter substrate-binding protein [Paenibacillus agricola]|uniref:Sugar ABC transporter substrate-binding protein n=1 Tax=Paenibacillus agricola TaxID=2716264 RepID=A0ABX0JES7_9BACL|nr:sugar ABC transporter substrate-binding protein [Paenibacillus agricola]NHN32381.1 sugar ABC transporter substrate-binding protein [Paenibacillus agricola]